MIFGICIIYKELIHYRTKKVILTILPHSRLDDLNIFYIRKIIYGLRDEGARKNSTYSLANKK